MSGDSPDLSVVIPCFNEESRLAATLAEVVEALTTRALTFEILVVDDGSRDGTAQVAGAFDDPRVRVLVGQGNRGKGHAVCRGVAEAAGGRVLITDADLSTPLDHLDACTSALDSGAGVAIGSRALPASDVRIHQPWLREKIGRMFNLFIRLIGIRGVCDTQCGFKLYSSQAARDAFSRVTVDGWAFDVEALVIARQHGHTIQELPVVWNNAPATRVHVLGDAIGTLVDLLRIRVRWGATRLD